MRAVVEPNTDVERIRIPKVAEVVAETLRRKIVTGEYQPGELLPPESTLMGTFDVARTTIRDAFRVLETEGLLEVRRGGGGGGRVQAPGVGMVASYAALLLQYQGTRVQDVHAARALIEAPLAGMLAERHAEPGLVDTLRRALEDEAAAEDELALTQAEARFHRLIVDLAGNRVLAMLSAVASRLIAQQIERLQQDASPRRRARPGFAEAHRAHEHVVELIAAGQRAKAEDFWRKHLQAAHENLASGTRAARSLLDLLP